MKSVKVQDGGGVLSKIAKYKTDARKFSQMVKYKPRARTLAPKNSVFELVVFVRLV